MSGAVVLALITCNDESVELRHLRSFAVLAEELHFARAARRLHVVQPALSQQIRALEEEIGAALFERTTRKVSLTPVGEIFLEHARRSLADVAQGVLAAQRASRGMVGMLAVGYVSSAAVHVLPEAVRAFRRSHRDVQLTMLELGTTEQLRGLAEGRIDVGFVLPGQWPCAPPSTSSAPDRVDAGFVLPRSGTKGLCFEVATEEPLMLIVPERHRFAARSSVPFSALADEDIIWMDRRSEPHIYDLYLQLCLQQGFNPRIVYEVGQLQSMLGLVAAGLGVSHAPASIRAVKREGVVYVPLTSPVINSRIAMAYDPENCSPALNAFLAATRLVAHKPRRGGAQRRPVPSGPAKGA